MRCLNPFTIRNDSGVNHVPCGKCIPCLQRKRSQWSFRLEQELSVSSSSYFITLTYSDDNLYFNEQGFASVNKEHVQKFMKRFRKSLNMSGIKYYAVAEYGSKTLRPHYHFIFFNLPNDINYVCSKLSDTWTYGTFDVGSVTPKSIRYVTKYCITKQNHVGCRDPVFSLMSKGLGKCYIENRKKWHLNDKNRFYVVSNGGVKSSLPRYYSEKIYSKLDRQIHAVTSTSNIDKKSMEEYYKYNKGSAINYYEYKRQQTEEYIRKVSSKINKLDKL